MAAYDLNGKVALVTGAARGIGFETARRAALPQVSERNGQIVLVPRSPPS